MILSAEAMQQLLALEDFYEDRGRLDALIKLRAAVADAIAAIEQGRTAGQTAPRPYPELARDGEAWIKTGRYWLCFSTAEPKQVLAIFFETADIPNPF